MSSRVVLVSALLLGCAEEAPTLDNAFGPKCPYNCNSEEMIHNSIYKASLLGRPNEDGIRIESRSGRASIYNKDGISYDLHVQGGRIWGTRAGKPNLEGGTLHGAEIRLRDRYNQPLGPITISAERATTFHINVDPLNPDPLHAYTLVWGSLANMENACVSQVDPTRWDLYQLFNNETVVFEGDDFDARTVTKERTFDPEWITFGCAGHTFSKLYQLRETLSSDPMGDWRGHQAAFKMVVADYCGTGIPFTRSGTPLDWKGSTYLTSYTAPTTLGLEARWDENGATCLKVPRLRYHPVPEFPDVTTAILEECPNIPWCADNDEHDLQDAERVTANLVQ